MVEMFASLNFDSIMYANQHEVVLSIQVSFNINITIWQAISPLTTLKFMFTLKSAHPFRTTSIQLTNFVELPTLIRIMNHAKSIARFPEVYNPVSHEYGDVKIVGDHVLRVLRAIDDIPYS